MKEVASTFAGLSEDDARTRYNLGRDVEDWSVQRAQSDVRSHPEAEKHVTPVLYRPFDERWTYYTGQSRGFMCRPRSDVMRHMRAGPNVGLIASRQASVDGGYSHVLVSQFLVDNRCVYSSRGIMSLFPLYIYPVEEESEKERAPNLSNEFVEAVGSAIGLEFTPEGSGDLENSFGSEDVFHYIYAVLHSPEYRRRYADFLKSDFPRVPITGNLVLFSGLVGLGRRLTSLHLMESEGNDLPSYPRSGSDRVDGVRYTPPKGDVLGRVFINAAQYFEGVDPETWEFTIGGYRPAEKWLKDRKNRELSYDDIVHYRRICGALAETPRVMARIDAAIESHGGWPLS